MEPQPDPAPSPGATLEFTCPSCGAETAYAPGTWGPKRAADLIEMDGRRWLHLNGEADPVVACSI